MANGKPTDPDDFVIRSGVRSGLKREFAFALKSQSQLSNSLSRTRSGKPTAPTCGSPYPDPKRIRKSDHESKDPQLEVKPEENQTVVEEIVVVDDEKKSKKKVFVGMPKRFTRSALKNSNSDAMLQDSSIACPVEEAPINTNGSDAGDSVVSSLPVSPSKRGTRLAAKTVVEDSETAVIPDAPMVVDSLPETKKQESPIACPVEESGTAPMETLINTNGSDAGDSVVSSLPETVVISEAPMVVDSLPETKEHEGSALETPIVIKDESKNHNDEVVAGKPLRRFTRSLLLKAAVADESPATEVSGTTSGSEEMKGGGGNNADDGSSSTTPSKKMELKMSKKIALNKLPANVRELLGTGLLEGMPVKYVTVVGKQYGLEGVIRGNGILCSCALCKGSKVVSAYNFELHAGSTKKHPSDNIFLENGKSIRDVIRACTSAPLDMLETVIQNSIGPLPPKNPSFCQKCKGYFHTPRTGKYALLCDRCLEPKQHQPNHFRRSLSPSEVTPYSAKLRNKVLTGDGSVGTSKSLSSQKKNILTFKVSSGDASDCTSKVTSCRKKNNLPAKVVEGDASDSASKNTSLQKKNIQGKLTKKDLGLHKLVFTGDILPEGTEVGYYVRGQRLLEGYIKDSGIFCRCCSTVVSPSQFEAHAGRAARRKPYNNIYTSNGVSLHELSVSLSKDRKLSASENDDLCSICGDFGDLLLCDLCPRAFHKECVGLSNIPSGDWTCRYCQSMHQRERCLGSNDNAIAAGRVAGVDPIEQILQRCIRIVTTSTDIGSCVLCKGHDFSKSGFGLRTVMLCDQCEKEYHVGCLKDYGMCDLKELPEGEWFCCTSCSSIHNALQELLLCGSQPLLDLHADTIRKKREEKGLHEDAEVRWRLLSGKTTSDESKLLLSQAVTIFHESFDPIVDAVTGRDLIPSMVYGRSVRDQDFGGTYCAILTVNSSVVSAGTLRVLGCDVAELPLVATSRESQGQGYFQSLFSCIERLLESLKIKHFVLPAADEAESIWTKKFGFSKIASDTLQDYTKGARPMCFQGTSMLHKPVVLSEDRSPESQGS